MRFLTQALFTAALLGVAFGIVEGSWTGRILGGLHIFPALERMAANPIDWFLLIFAVFLILTRLRGRFYCSRLCPVGFVQDLSGRYLAALVKTMPDGGPARRSRKKLMFMRWFFLVAALISVIAGGSLHNHADHFSAFFKSMHDVVTPLVCSCLSPFAETINRSGYMTIPEKPFESTGDPWSSLVFLAVILLAPAVWPRFFCTCVCPSGSIFSLLTLNMRSRVRLNGRCVRCSSCDRICPTGCMKHGVKMEQACIDCGECAAVCPVGVLKPGPPGLNTGSVVIESEQRIALHRLHSRREAIKAGMAVAAGSALGVLAPGRPRFPAGSGQASGLPVMPPGAGTAGSFYPRCTACGICACACPTGVIRPMGLERGLGYLGKPMLDFERSYCSYECGRCSQVCPSNALRQSTMEIKKVTRLGTAFIDKNICVPWVAGTDCGACAEHCPTGAVSMIPKPENPKVLIPAVKEDLCIGCGVCQHACPTRPVRAITVKPAEVQTLAMSPSQARKAAVNGETSQTKSAATGKDPGSASETKAPAGPEEAFPF